ncbi:MAG: FkbM family methyltransferase [Candidatus Paceibacterota bacterium]
MKPLKTPILFIAFNRPGPTKDVFAEIRKARPEKLFVAVDGPRKDRPEDVDKVNKVQEIVSQVDWPCEVKKLFRTENLGCKIGATSAITWFFEHVEEGIIVEDDCLPEQSFFAFCSEMLEHFRNEPRVAMICGYNIEKTSDLPYSYTFSRYGHLWGWASWKRIWDQYDVTMKVWDNIDNRKKIRKAMDDYRQWNYREWLYNETYEGRKDTWDYQWESYRLLHSQICVIPNRNMIRNLGFGADATHTKQTTSHLVIPGQTMKFPLAHNPDLVASDYYDRLLRPKIKAQSRLRRSLKDRSFRLGKLLLPPFIYQLVRKLIRGTKVWKPIWNTLDYEPMAGVKMFFDPSGSWQSKMKNGSYDKFMFDRVSAIGAEGKVIYDIGAHVGYHSLYFARLVGKNGKVITIEPNKKNFERLKKNIDENKDLKERISAFNIAVGDKDGKVEFNINEDVEGGRSTGSFIGTADTFSSRETYKNKGFTKTSVDLVTIDSFEKMLSIHDAPDIIKIDVEGAESLALEGARGILLAKKPVLFVEIHSMRNMSDVMNFLHSISYEAKIANIEGNGVCYIEAHAK